MKASELKRIFNLSDECLIQIRGCVEYLCNGTVFKIQGIKI